jgi:uncharacterized integral membrane protein
MSTKLKLKLAGSIVILALCALVIYQNRELLSHPFPLVFFKWTTGDVPNAAYLLTFFLMGALSVFVVSLRSSFRSKSVIQSLQDELAAEKGPAPADKAGDAAPPAETP